MAPVNSGHLGRFGFKFWGSLFVCVFGSLLLYFASIINGPDRDLTWKRVVPSEVSIDKVDQAIAAVVNWPQWFYSTVDAKMIDLAGNPYSMKDQVLAKGGIVKLWVDPKRSPWSKFQITLRVLEYKPKEELRLALLTDLRGA